ncbi:MAG: DEAD/DEAH box helicase [Planctomycetaceae bacterium]|nr:DEAD/DEAH box helicase [Planctomycetaceae bacterium]
MSPSTERQILPDDPPSALKGVGPAKAALLARAGLGTLRALASLPPAALAETQAVRSLADAARAHGATVRVRARLVSLAWTRLGPRRQSALRATLADGDTRLDALFVGQPWLKKRLPIGAEVELEGRVGGSRVAVLVAPKLAPAAGDVGELLPIYPAIEGISEGMLRGLVGRAFEALRGGWEEDVPDAVLERLDLPREVEALAELVQPTSRAKFERARRRLALGALLGFQARLAQRLARGQREGEGSSVSLGAGADVEALAPELLEHLPFVPTDGQRRVVGEVLADLSRPAPMRRLLQGDVGAGKTAIALVAALAVHRFGGQIALLAPTQLLAEQHMEASRELFARAGLAAELYVGRLSVGERRRCQERLGRGEVHVLVGTHALIFGDLPFVRLGLLVIDEQHRFGVAQRRRLLERHPGVHALLMTATPIPRTLALSFYGDLEVSALREKPPGRQKVRTHLVPPAKRAELLLWLERHLEEGGRAFWVAPRIESTSEGQGAEDLFAEFAGSPLGVHGVELVHGRQDAAVRRAALERLRSGEARLLVGTTVLEVGVDVPEATVMVVEGAERFGLAQLHQLRGRVGRSSRPSMCFLIAEGPRAARLEVLVRTDDGFAIAEEDLRQRGMGDLLGLRQSGANAEGLSGFEDDFELWSAACELVSEDSGLRERILLRSPRPDAAS